MQIKLFEVRDRATFVPCIGISTWDPIWTDEKYLVRRCGYSLEEDGGCVLFGRLDGSGRMPCDPYEHKDRTMQAAHQYVERNWSQLDSGDVVDVEFILGETAAPKLSERI